MDHIYWSVFGNQELAIERGFSTGMLRDDSKATVLDAKRVRVDHDGLFFPC